MRLRLQSNPDMFNRPRNHRIRNPRERACAIELAVGEAWCETGCFVPVLEEALGVAETAELDGDAGADAEEGGEGAFIEGEGAFVAVDGGCGVEGGVVGGGGLEADFDDIEWLAWGNVSPNALLSP
jgi:hypothetical protein